MNYFLGILLAIFTAIIVYYTGKVIVQMYKSHKVGYVVRFDKVQVLTVSKTVAKDDKVNDVITTDIYIFIDRTLALEAFIREQRKWNNNAKVELHSMSVYA